MYRYFKDDKRNLNTNYFFLFQRELRQTVTCYITENNPKRFDNKYRFFPKITFFLCHKYCVRTDINARAIRKIKSMPKITLLQTYELCQLLDCYMLHIKKHFTKLIELSQKASFLKSHCYRRFPGKLRNTAQLQRLQKIIYTYQ